MAIEELPLFGNRGHNPSPIPAIAAFPLSMVGIFKEAIKIPSRNAKLILQVFLTVLFPFSLIVLLHYHLAGPLMEEMEDSYEKNGSLVDHEEERILIGYELAFLAALWLVCFFGMVLTVQGSSSVYQGKVTGLMEMVFRIWPAPWRKAMITWMYVSLLTLSYALLAGLLVRLLMSIESALTWLVGILALVLYLFLDAHWTVGLVVSVLEGGGGESLGRSRKLIRGRRFDGFQLMLILVLLSAPVYVVFYITATDDDDKLDPFAQFSFGLASTVLACTAKLFTYVVFTVFYFECKQSHGEKLEETLGQEEYCPLSGKHQAEADLCLHE